MSSYLLLKWIHILSSVLMVGTGFGSAFYLFFILRSRHITSITDVTRLVVNADWWFTTPAILIQPLTGIIMIELAGYPYTHTWVVASVFLYLIAGLCWLPVVVLQIKMHQIASNCQQDQQNLPEKFWRYAKYWQWLGYPAFSAMLVIYALMVFKP